MGIAVWIMWGLTMWVLWVIVRSVGKLDINSTLQAIARELREIKEKNNIESSSPHTTSNHEGFSSDMTTLHPATNQVGSDSNMSSFKLQRIIEFSFAPTASLLERLEKETEINIHIIDEWMARQAKHIDISIVDYSNGLRMIKREKHLKDSDIQSEWIEYPYEFRKDYHWEAQNASYREITDKFLFSYKLGECASLLEEKNLHIGYKDDCGKISIVVFIEDRKNKRNTVLFQLPIYGDQLEKYSVLRDDYRENNKMFRMYEGLDNPEDCCFDWKLNVIEHEDLVALRVKNTK